MIQFSTRIANLTVVGNTIKCHFPMQIAAALVIVLCETVGLHPDMVTCHTKEISSLNSNSPRHDRDDRALFILRYE